MDPYRSRARSRTLFEGLARIDKDLAADARVRGCPRCRAPLDYSRWRRHPRGGEAVPPWVRWRHGLCCRGCRRRVLPPSALFLGRKVYWAAVVLVSVAARQRRVEGSTAAALRKLFGVSAETLARWLSFFRDDFPISAQWRTLRGRVSPVVRDDDLPAALLAQFDDVHGPVEAALAACLRFLASAAVPHSPREG